LGGIGRFISKTVTKVTGVAAKSQYSFGDERVFPKRRWTWRDPQTGKTAESKLGRRLLTIGVEPLIDQRNLGVDRGVTHPLLLGDELH
jgi:hypothetical protein